MNRFYRYTFLWCLLTTVPAIMVAQDIRRTEADQYFNANAYAPAIKAYLKVEQNGLGDFETKIRLAQAYYAQRDFKNALEWLDKAGEINRFSDKYLALYAELLKVNGHYAKADSIYQQLGKQYKKLQSDQLRKIRPAHYDVLAINGFNTVEDEMSPAYYRDGLVFVSSSRKQKSNYSWNDRPWLQVKYLPYKPTGSENGTATVFKAPFNDFYHSGPVTFTRQDNLMYFTKSVRSTGKAHKEDANLGIFSVVRKQDKWSELKPFAYNSSKYSVGHPAASSDGREMFFVSDMPGGHGGTDIYYSKFSNGKWTTPINLGPVINTDKDEMFPFYHTDGTLYFASEGHLGFGGLDIFYSRFENGVWSAPVNMGSPVNSGYDDFGIILDKTKMNGYFTSNRPGGAGNDDIYRLQRKDTLQKEEELVFTAGGLISDKVTLEALKNAVIYVKTADGKVYSATTNGAGYYQLKMPVNVLSVPMQASAYGYFPSEQILNRDEQTLELMANFYLEKIEVNKTIIIPNIYYDLDQATITPDAVRELDKLVVLLNTYPDWIVEIGAHTDSRADANYNLKLSDKRAAAVVSYLVEKGIRKERLYSKGYGESRLINGCSDQVKCTEEEHALNRRTEFRLIGYEPFTYQEAGKDAVADKVIFAPEYQAAGNLEYYIQIGVFQSPDKAKIQQFSDLGNVRMIPAEGQDMVKFMLTSYATYETALGYLRKVQERGVKDAFIVAYYKGKPITLEEAAKKIRK